jgi:hypothetical protein
MKLTHGLLLIGLMAAVGMAKVAERTAIVVSAYQLGRATAAAHALENETGQLRTHVIRLQSPAQLIHVMRDRKLDMVAWSMASPSTAPAPSAAPAGAAPTRIAATGHAAE